MDVKKRGACAIPMSELFKYKVLTYQLRAINSMRFKEYAGHVDSEV